MSVSLSRMARIEKHCWEELFRRKRLKQARQISSMNTSTIKLQGLYWLRRRRRPNRLTGVNWASEPWGKKWGEFIRTGCLLDGPEGGRLQWQQHEWLERCTCHRGAFISKCLARRCTRMAWCIPARHEEGSWLMASFCPGTYYEQLTWLGSDVTSTLGSLDIRLNPFNLKLGKLRTNTTFELLELQICNHILGSQKIQNIPLMGSLTVSNEMFLPLCILSLVFFC